MEVTQSTVIKLSKEECNVLNNLIGDLYDIYDEDKYVGRVMNDIYNAKSPRADEKECRYEGDVATIIITK